jgi:multiple sugar transport system permease protein
MAISDSAAAGLLARKPVARMAVHVLLITASVAFAFPFLWMLSTSLKPIEQILSAPQGLWPTVPRFRNYAEALRVLPFATYALNSLLVCTLSALGTTLSSALVAFSFTRLQWPGRDLVFALTLISMMVPFPVLMVPLYGVFKALGWVGTLKPLWLPAFFGNAFNIFLLRQFFLRIPKSLSEAMTLDGASELAIFRHVYLRLSAAPLAVVALFQITYSWNDFLGPLLFLTDQRTFTLSLGLQFYQSQHGGTAWHYLMAASVLTTVPIVLVFFLAQKALFRGLNMMRHLES